MKDFSRSFWNFENELVICKWKTGYLHNFIRNYICRIGNPDNLIMISWLLAFYYRFFKLFYFTNCSYLDNHRKPENTGRPFRLRVQIHELATRNQTQDIRSRVWSLNLCTTEWPSNGVNVSFEWINDIPQLLSVTCNG